MVYGGLGSTEHCVQLWVLTIIGCNECTWYILWSDGQIFLYEFLSHTVVSFIDTVHADLSISTSTPTPCYGDVVTLVCHHPEVAGNPGRYFTTTPIWRENGVGITPSTGIYLHDDTSEDLINTTLTITITVDHFRNKSFNYSCILALAENGIPTGEVETSGEITVDPVGEWVLHTNVYTCTVITLNTCH